MRRRAAPFGNDLQDAFDVKLIGGKIVHVSKLSPITHSGESTDAYKMPSCTKGTELRENVTADSSQNSSSSPKDVVKLSPIHRPTDQLQKAKFHHSAPPKLNCLTTNNFVNDEPCSSSIYNAVHMFTNQLKALQRKRPHVFEDIARSCTRLDDFRTGTVSLRELADVLYVNGVTVGMDTLKEFVEHNGLTVSGNSDRILYNSFIDRMVGNDDNNVVVHSSQNNDFEPIQELRTHESNKSNSFLHKQLFYKQDDLGVHWSGLPSRVAMSCPERTVTTATTFASHDSVVEDDLVVDDVSTLLNDLQSCFGGTRWGSHGDVQRLDSALSKVDKHNSGLLTAVVVSRIFHDQCVPLRGEVMDKALMRCETAQGMIRWTELMELIRKALSRFSRSILTDIEGTHRSTTNTGLHTSTVQQEGITHDRMESDDILRQAEELAKRVSSQQTKTDDPLVKLCNALCTCDAHKTGFLDVKTVIRMVRNYNIVYRMGLDVAALESFAKSNSTKSRSYHGEAASSTFAVVSISLVVNHLLQELEG